MLLLDFFSIVQEAFVAFHPDQKFVRKFLKPLLIGELAVTEPSQDPKKNVNVIFVNSSLLMNRQI